MQLFGADMAMRAAKQQLSQRNTLPRRPEPGHAQHCRQTGRMGRRTVGEVKIGHWASVTRLIGPESMALL
jgi:hypothetical protein